MGKQIENRTKIKDEFGKRECDVIDTQDDRIIEIKVGKQYKRLSMNNINAQAGPYKSIS